jgi:hypothetical protein
MISTFIKRLNFEFYQIRNGNFKHFWKKILKGINHQEKSLGFKLDLNGNIKQPRSLKKVEVRPSRESDEAYFIAYNPNNGLINQIQTCYVATINEGIPCFRCWLIDSSQNKKIKELWGETYPKLEKDEVLLENAMTIPQFRGMGLHPIVMYLVAMKSKNFGANIAVSFALLTNINALRSFNYAGFFPYTLRIEKWFLFRKTVYFKEVPPEILEHYNKVTGRKGA